MENYFDDDDEYYRRFEVPYETKGIIDRAWDTLQCLGIHGDTDEIVEFFEPIGYSETDIANLIVEFNELALGGVDPIDNIDDRAHAVAYLLGNMLEEIEEHKKHQETE